MLLFQRLNCRLCKNVAGILASADVLVTGVPSLQPGPGFCQFKSLDLGLGEVVPFPPTEDQETSQSPRRGLGENLVNMAGLPEQVLQSAGRGDEGNARFQTPALLLTGCVTLGKLLNLSGHQFPSF